VTVIGWVGLAGLTLRRWRGKPLPAGPKRVQAGRDLIPGSGAPGGLDELRRRFFTLLEPFLFPVTTPGEARSGLMRAWTMPSVPPPDTPAGRVLATSLIVGIVYALFLVADNVSFANQSAWFVPLPLILATIVTFSIASSVGADYARVRQFELELARTVAVHTVAGQLPEAETPIGGVLKEYVRTADELRRHARVHAYAAGASLYGALLTLGAAVFWGMSLTSGAIWLTYLAVLVELPALMLLVFAVTILGTAVGCQAEVPGFEALTPHRWRHYSEPNLALDAALTDLPWLEEFAEATRAPRSPT